MDDVTAGRGPIGADRPEVRVGPRSCVIGDLAADLAATAPGLADPTVGEGRPFPAGGHVAVVRLDGMGDVLLAGPAVRAVAARADRTTFICGPSGAEAAALLPGVDRVEVCEVPWVPLRAGAVDPTASLELIGRWRRLGLDAAIVLTSDHQSPLPTALLLKLADAGLVAGVSADHPGSLLDVRLRRAEGHEVQRDLALAAAAGYPAVDGDDLRVEVPPDRAAERRAGAGRGPAGSAADDGTTSGRAAIAHARPSSEVPRGAVVVHPGATVPSRGLPVDATRALVAALVADDIPVVLTGTAAETAALAIEPAPAGIVDLGGRTDLAELARVLARASALVVGNTGPAHLGAAVGVPVVSVFAPVVPVERWRPWTPTLEVLGQLDIWCRGCRARACPFPDQPCTSSVDAAVLHAAVVRALRPGTPNRSAAGASPGTAAGRPVQPTNPTDQAAPPTPTAREAMTRPAEEVLVGRSSREGVA